MRTTEQERINRVTIHSIDEAIWKLGIRLNNEEWIRFVEIFDVLMALEVI